MTRASDLARHQVALKTALLEFTDGDDAITIADAGIVTLLTSALIKSEGGAATSIIGQGLCKVWVNFNGTSTIAARDSFNMTSLTDNGTGDYTTTFANDFSNANYVFLGNSMHENSRSHVHGQNSATAYATGTMRGISAFVSGTNGEDTADDGTIINRAYVGDLA